MWEACCDNDLDALTFQLLDAFDDQRRSRLLGQGFAANDNSLTALESFLREGDSSVSRFLLPQIYAGTVWWNHFGALPPQLKPLAINDFQKLEQELNNIESTLVFLFDDNGELVWDLMMVLKLLTFYPHLKVVGVVSTEVVANNANIQTISRCLKHRLLDRLTNHSRFKILPEPNVRSAIDPAFCSSELLDLFRSAAAAFIKGVSYFATIQRLEIPAFYAFVVHGQDSEKCTGLKEGDGVFARIPPGESGFEYGKASLSELQKNGSRPRHVAGGGRPSNGLRSHIARRHDATRAIRLTSAIVSVMFQEVELRLPRRLSSDLR